MKKLCFYVSEEFVGSVKRAIFAVGGGEYDGFKNCSWQTKGQGQYQIEGDSLVEITEYKLEIYCRDEIIVQALKALVDAHPCTKPAYDVTDVENWFG